MPGLDRQRMWDAAGAPDEVWDIAIIGGGATGLGTALDAASRGYRTALFEAADFAKGTSSRSTKLIHGGVRYLRQGQIKMVRESLIERGRLARNAPHVVHARQFVIPSFTLGSRYYYLAGMKAYDLLAGKLGFAASHLLSRTQTLRCLPTLRPTGLRGGVSYHDGQFDDARLAIALATTAAQENAIVLNYCPVIRLLVHDGKIAGVVVRDVETGQEISVRAKAVVNATGVFAESVIQMDESSKSAVAPTVVASQGTHLILPQAFMPGDTALLIPNTDDSRVLFAIPWQGRTLLGTTDHQVEKIELEPRPLPSEVEYLLEHAGRFLTQQPNKADVLSAFSGLRPLVGAGRTNRVDSATAQMSREHALFTSASGLITIVGGKWTTYRKMAEEIVDLAARVADLRRKPCVTADLPLNTEAPTRTPTSAELLHPNLPYTTADVTQAVCSEAARTVEDVLSRRTRALLLDAAAASSAASRVAEIMQPLLDRDDEWKKRQLREFEQLARGYQVHRKQLDAADQHEARE